MDTTNPKIQKAAEPLKQPKGLLYPTMLIAAIAVILFSVIGIATMAGLMPSALSQGGDKAAPAAQQGNAQ